MKVYAVVSFLPQILKATRLPVDQSYRTLTTAVVKWRANFAANISLGQVHAKIWSAMIT